MTHREVRAARIGGTVLVLAILVLRVAPWGVQKYRSLREETALQNATLARMREAIDQVAGLADSSENVRRRFLALAPVILAGGTQAAAVASLSGHLDVAASRSGVMLERVDALPDSVRAGGLHRVTVRASLEGDTPAVAAALCAIEMGSIVLSTDSVSIAARDPDSAEAGPEVLRLEIVVSGWYLERTAE